jgi:hypothetical protein
MHYFEATENQFVEIVQALSLPSGWSVHTKVSDDKVSQIFLTPPSGPEYYYIEIFNPITYEYYDADNNWVEEKSGEIQISTK